jgi:DNA-binding response OmpR family regulator
VEILAATSNGALMILIVDDDPDHGRLLLHMLAEDGFEAAHVPTGEDALDCLATVVPTVVPTVVVLDDHMPGMSGLDVIRELRKQARYRATPIIFYSAGGDAERRRAALQLGAAAWLEKGKTSWPDVISHIEQLARIASRPAGD